METIRIHFNTLEGLEAKKIGDDLVQEFKTMLSIKYTTLDEDEKDIFFTALTDKLVDILDINDFLKELPD